MNEELAKDAAIHIGQLESVLVTLERIDSYQLDGPDANRLSSAKRNLKREVEFFRSMTHAIRDEVAA
jgi:hypothetical protein